MSDEPLFHTKDYEPALPNGRDAAAVKEPRFKPVRFRDIKLSTTAAYLVKGLIPRDGLIVVWGPPKCGKSFWTFDLGMHIALGWDYRDRRVSPGAVVYIACEGERGLAARKEAFQVKKLSEDADPPFYLLTTRLNLVADADELIADIRQQIGDAEIVAVVIDTLNRTIAGSESSDADMSDYVKAADKVREAFKAAVIIIHHCGIEGSRPRGHTSLTGAADAQIAVKRDDDDTVVCTIEFMKDGAQGDQIGSRLERVEIGLDDDGDVIDSLVVQPMKVDPSDKRATRLTPTEQAALRCLRDAIDNDGFVPDPPNPNIPENVRCAREEVWREYCYRGSINKTDKPDAKRMAFNRASSALINKANRAKIWDGWVWIPREHSEHS